MTAELLAAILADPDDLAARAVYGDWLCEQQDPRGELIALQLAPPSKATTARIAKLIDTHGDAWAAPLDAWFQPGGRRFDGGFFAGGALRFPSDRMDPATIANEPAWRLVRVIENTWSREEAVIALAEHPQLCALREVMWISSAAAEQLAARPRPWTALAWWMDPPRAPWAGLATLDNLPALTTLGVVCHQADLSRAWLASAPVLERIAQLRLRSSHDVGYAIEVAATRSGALRTVTLEVTDVLGNPSAWQIELSRDGASGPFTRAVARPSGGKVDPLQLIEPFAMVPQTLRELAIVTGRKLTVRADHRKKLAKAIARFKQLERCELPWDDVAATPKPRTGLERYELHFDGPNLFERGALTAMWQCLVGELAQPYDAFEVGDGKALHPIGDDPLQRIAGWSERTDRLRLVHDGGPETFELRRIGRFERVKVELATDRSPDDVAAWLLRFATAARFEAGACATGTKPIYERFDLGLLRLGVLGSWLTWFGAPFRDALPPALALDGASLHPTPDGVMLRTAPTARDATKSRLASVAAALREATIAALPATLGFDFATEVGAALGEPLAALGFERVASEHWTELRFVKPGKVEHRAAIAIQRVDDYNLPASLLDLSVHATLSAQRRGDARDPSKLELVRGRVAGRAQLLAFIGQIRDALATRGAAWIAAPLPK